MQGFRTRARFFQQLCKMENQNESLDKNNIPSPSVTASGTYSLSLEPISVLPKVSSLKD